MSPGAGEQMIALVVPEEPWPVDASRAYGPWPIDYEGLTHLDRISEFLKGLESSTGPFRSVTLYRLQPPGLVDHEPGRS